MKTTKIIVIILLSFFLIGCEWTGSVSITTDTDEMTSLTTTEEQTSIPSETLPTQTTSIATTTTSTTTTTPETTTTARISKQVVLSAFESRFAELMTHSIFAYQSSVYQEFSDVSTSRIYDSFRIDTAIDYDLINQVIHYYSEDSENFIVSLLLDLNHERMYDYYAEDGNLYKNVIEGAEYADFLSTIDTQDGDYFSWTLLSGLPDWTTFEILSSKKYAVAFSIYDLFEYDAKFASDVLGLLEPAHSPYDYAVTVIVDLSDGLALEVSTQSYPTNELGFRLNYDMSFKESISVPDVLTPQKINDNHYFETTFDDPSDCDRSYDPNTMHEVLILPESDNYFRFELEPGYYNFDLYWDFSSKFHATLYDSNMNVVYYHGFYKIETANTYFLNVTTDETEATRLELTLYSYPEETLGAFDNPLIAGDELSGTILMGESDYYYLIRNCREGYVVVNMTGGDFGPITVGDGRSFQSMWVDGSVGFLVEEGQDLILIVKGEMETFDYILSWKFQEIPTPTNDLASMQSISIRKTLILPISSPSYSQVFALTIAEEADYTMIHFVGYDRNVEHVYLSQLYNDQGVLLQEFDNDQNSVVYHFEPGTYYIMVTGNGEQKFILSYFIYKE
jgi:hypothetical protein